MEKPINLDLASIVLGLKIYGIKIDGENISFKYDSIGEIREQKMCVDTFISRCKSWARNLDKVVGGVPLFSMCADKHNQGARCYCDRIDLGLESQKAKTELEAVHNICELIYEKYYLKDKEKICYASS